MFRSSVFTATFLALLPLSSEAQDTGSNAPERSVTLVYSTLDASSSPDTLDGDAVLLSYGKRYANGSGHVWSLKHLEGENSNGFLTTETEMLSFAYALTRPLNSTGLLGRIGFEIGSGTVETFDPSLSGSADATSFAVTADLLQSIPLSSTTYVALQAGIGFSYLDVDEAAIPDAVIFTDRLSASASARVFHSFGPNVTGALGLSGIVSSEDITVGDDDERLDGDVSFIITPGGGDVSIGIGAATQLSGSGQSNDIFQIFLRRRM